MSTLNPYLTFGGNCVEAMNFYKDCLGGELKMNTLGDSTAGKDMPDYKDQIMHAELKSDGIVFYASDMMGPKSVVVGNAVNLCVNSTDEAWTKEVFAKLAEGGKVGHELKLEFWGDMFGDFTDKYGIRWMFNCSKPKA